MKTSGSFGFISYNSREFLENVLKSFIDRGIFTRCACWFHESLGTEKNHFHCYVEAAKQIDTSMIVDDFIEFDENGNQQSIAIRNKCKSEFVNAYLYGIHNSDYLAYKGKMREEVNIITDKHIYLGDFTIDIAEAEDFCLKKCLAPYMRIKRLVYAGASLEDVYINLRIPFAQLNAVAGAYRAIIMKMHGEMSEAEIGRYLNELGAVEDKTPSPFDKCEQTKII